MDKRVVRYLRLDSWLFQTTVSWTEVIPEPLGRGGMSVNDAECRRRDDSALDISASDGEKRNIRRPAADE